LYKGDWLLLPSGFPPADNGDPALVEGILKLRISFPLTHSSTAIPIPADIF
jgi:hypothetical protein